MPGARLGDRVFLGEGTLVPAGMVLPDDAVAVGRPARIIRTASTADLERLAACATATSRSRHRQRSTSDHDGGRRHGPALRLPRDRAHDRRDRRSCSPPPRSPATSSSASGTIIGAGVKIIGDSHGPVRIGDDVQILENTVLHLLPDNELVIDDGASSARAR